MMDKPNQTKPNQTEILLVVGNDEEATVITAELKTNNFRHRPVRARNGIEALEFIFGTGPYADGGVTKRPALILVDLVQDGDVEGFLRILRAYLSTGAIPVIALTRRGEERKAPKPDEHVNGYVPKPFSFEEFSNTLRSSGLQDLLK